MRRPSLFRLISIYSATIVVVLGLTAGTLVTRRVSGYIDQEHRDAVAGLVRRLANLIEQTTAERLHEVRILGMVPDVIDQAAVAFDQSARSRPEASVDAGSARARRFLATVASRSSFENATIVDSGGHTLLAVAVDGPRDYSREPWFARVMADGAAMSPAVVDTVRGLVAVEFAAAIGGRGSEGPAGALVVGFPLGRLGSLIQRELHEFVGATVQLEDVDGTILYSSDAPTKVGTRVDRAAAATTVGDSGAALPVRVEMGVRERVGTAVLPGAGWRLIVRMPEPPLLATLMRDRALLADAAVFALVALGVLVPMMLVLRRRIVLPVAELEGVASTVAQGDLSVMPRAAHLADDEVGRLGRAVATMVEALRDLASTMRAAAAEATQTADTITESATGIRAASAAVADSTQELQDRALGQSALAQETADDTVRIQTITEQLAHGAAEAAERNAALAQLAAAERARLEASAAALMRLVTEVELGAEDANALAVASQEIQAFVTQTKHFADETQLLSLNASIEAARAGEQGRGFAVVAAEFRRLSTAAGAAAEATSGTVARAQRQVEAARARLLRLAESGAISREAAVVAASSLAGVAEKASATDEWTRQIAAAANDAQQLVRGIARRTMDLAATSEDHAATVTQIAGAAEQLTASAEELTRTADALAAAGSRLTIAVEQLRWDAREP
jgi:methyl-accepting chemotaxis protein